MTAPVMDRPGSPAPAAERPSDTVPGRTGLKALVASWRSLRHTPYGTRPAAVFAFLGLVGGLAGPAFAQAAPDIIVDLKIDIRDILSVQSTIGFSTEPIPSTSTRTRSPGSRKTGGSRNTPTPAGVPVAMTSPGSSVIDCEMKLTSVGMS